MREDGGVGGGGEAGNSTPHISLISGNLFQCITPERKLQVYVSDTHAGISK